MVRKGMRASGMPNITLAVVQVTLRVIIASMCRTLSDILFLEIDVSFAEFNLGVSAAQ